MPDHAILVSDLVVRYGALTAVDGLSFDAPAGAITAVLGPNGAGKTTTIEVLEGFRRPDGGQVKVLGLDPWTDHRDLVRRVGVMPQDGGVHRGIRVAEAVQLYAAFHRDPLDPDTLVDRVGLSARRTSPWRTLSGGEQQRLSLALALVGRPELVFLDEPTAGVDVAGRRIVHDLVRGLRSDGTTVVCTTHDLAEAESLADHLVIVDHGRVVAAGSPSEISGQAGPPELRFGGPPDLDVAELAVHLDAPVTETTPGEYLVARDPDPATVARLTAWLAARDLPLADLRAGRQRLEDVFLRLTHSDDGDEAPER